MHHTICCVGHITHDKVTTPSSTVHMPGGTAFYFSHAMACLDPEHYVLVTALAETDFKAVRDLRSMGVEVEALPSVNTVFFENIYGDDMNHRTQRVRAKADPFCESSMAGVEAVYYHLGTLLADDFSAGFVKWLAGKGKVSVDAQGFLRCVVGEDVHPCDWPDKRQVLPYVDILKANEHEMESLTGQTDAYKAARILADWGVKETVLTLGDRGSVVYAGGVFHDIPAYAPRRVVDATGCGDTYMAGYLYKRAQGASPFEAGKFAAAMCTIKLENSGPFHGSESDIMQVIREHEKE